MKVIISAALALALGACALPQTTVRTGASQPGLIVDHDKALFSGGETHPIKLLPVAAQ